MLLPRAFTLGLNLGPTTELTPVVHAEEPIATIQTNVVFDDHGSIMPLRIDRPVPSIEKIPSRADEEALKAAETARARSAQQSVVVSAPREPEPDLGTKRALVQQVAGQAGIDWKLLESVWQIESGKAWHTGVASSAGAMGPMQFMPGTWASYGGSGDVTYAPDALRAAAKLLASDGAATGNIDQALFAYNHATWYVEQVKSIMASI